MAKIQIFFVSVTDKAKKYSPLAVIADLIRDPLKQKGLLNAKEMADVPPP